MSTKPVFQMLSEIERLTGGAIKTAAYPSVREAHYDAVQRLIRLSLESTRGEAWRAAFQGLQGALFTRAELGILDDAFQPGAPLRLAVEERLRELGESHRLEAPQWNGRTAQAWGFQFYMEDRFETRGHTMVQRLFERLRAVLYRVRHLAFGLGFRSAEDVFQAVATEQYGRRVAEDAREPEERRWEGRVGFRDENGELHPLGRCEVRAASRYQAEQKAHEALWDPRLDSASCSPVVSVESLGEASPENENADVPPDPLTVEAYGMDGGVEA